MRDVEHDNGVGLLLDPVTDAPVLPAARGVLACVFVAKRMPDTVRIVKEGPTIELGGCGGDLFGQPRELALRSEEHTSELQSHSDLVCRLLLEKKKKINTIRIWEETLSACKD